LTKIHSKAAFLKAISRKSETVDISGDEVTVSELTATEYMAVYNNPRVLDEKGVVDGLKFTALLIARCVVDKDGDRMLTDDDIDMVAEGSSAAFGKLGEAVKQLNGIGVAGNSAPSRNASLPSD
jgi:hypothetical protein